MVDFPAPLSPTNPTRSPAPTRNESSRCAARRPPGYANDTFSNATVGASGRSSATGAAGGSTFGCASSTAKTSSAAAGPNMPVCSSARRSRWGRNTSMPIIRTTSSTSRLIWPWVTRHAPYPSTAALPTAMPVSVRPRVRALVASTHIVLRNTSRARSARSRPRVVLCPNALRVASPCTASRNSAANPRYAFDRRLLLRASQCWKSHGAHRVNIANPNISAATGKSKDESHAKTTRGVMAATRSCGTYSPNQVSSCSTPSIIESSTAPVRSSPKWAGPSATTLA